MKIKLKVIIYTPFLIIHLLLFHLSKNKELIKADLKAWAHIYRYINADNLNKALLTALTTSEAFRTQFLFRIGRLQNLVPWFRGLKCCDLGGDTQVGGGLVIRHGYGLVINGQSVIGSNCTILQNVTIGSIRGGYPKIGDNVFIGAGAIIIGGVKVGNNVNIGAGAIVLDDVPDNCTVVCDKARIIRK